MSKRLLKLLRRTPILGRGSVRAELARRSLAAFGRMPSIDAPQSFNERILHRMLYDRDPRLRTVCDKLAVREFIRAFAGPDFVVPLLGVWKDPASIPWDDLPQQFVLKPNHFSGRVAIVRDHADRDPTLLCAMAAKWLRRDYFDVNLEWGYRGMPRRLLAEPLLAGPDGAPLVEVQLLTFHGAPAIVRLLTGEKLTPDRRDNWFDMEGRRLPIGTNIRTGNLDFPRDDIRILKEASVRVAAGFSHLRVDFYLTNEGPKIGELTPYHQAGRARWIPPEADEKLGQLWEASARADA